MVYTTTGPQDDGETWKGVQGDEPQVETGPAGTTGEPAADAIFTQRLQLAFAPIHKRAFGTAVGVAVAVLLAGVTLLNVLIQPGTDGALGLLNQYFYGYTVSLTGVLVGGFWGFVVGFVGGWFVAFCRNLAIAISVFVTRTRAELSETREFLDHI
jgi:hypothetical protein